MKINKLIIFDLDGTLIDIDCAQTWLEFLVEKQIIHAEHTYTLCETIMETYESSGIDMSAYMQSWLELTHSLSNDEFAHYINEFIDNIVKPSVYPKGLQCLKKHLEGGNTVVIVSASPTLIVTPIAKRLFGVEHSIGICAISNVNSLLKTGSAPNANPTYIIKQPMSFRAGKVHCVEDEYINSPSYYHKEIAIAYSDSQNDLPLLRAAKQAICVNPSEELSAIAKQANWPILNWQLN